MENLRFMLLSFNKNDPLYIGARFKFGVPNGYMSGGSGVILTKAAINRLVPNFGNASICPQATSDNDDLELGICVQNLNIISVDTRDNQTFDCCAEHMISFHYVYGEMLYMIEFLIYHAKLIGIVDHAWVQTITSTEREDSRLSILEQLKKASKNVNFNRFQDL
uniref:N-acetylgalactosaminide beta-1,3-galactosyltransferase n=1 Tax=Panagrolaimus davidi TaxID=227884 RepID=A0A914PXK7_9BILA